MTQGLLAHQGQDRRKSIPFSLFSLTRRCSRHVLLALSITSVFTFVVLHSVLLNNKEPGMSSILNTSEAMPNGRHVPVYNISIQTKAISELLHVCEYDDHDKLECPNVKMQGETVVRQVQLAVGRLLRILHVMSQRHHFNYWLFGGALIGSVRHQRFVPWDEDGDVCMMREDYEVFLKHAMEELPGDVFLQTAHTDLEWAKVQRWHEARLRDATSCYGSCFDIGFKYHDGYQVDVIVLDQTSDGATVYDPLNGAFRWYKNEVFPLRSIDFEGFSFNAPKEIDTILRRRYGDFSRPPPTDQHCGQYLGVPWLSCDEMAALEQKQREELLNKSKIICS